MSKQVLGTKEWSVVSVNFQTGCQHGCRYCYARESAVDRYKQVKPGEWENEHIRKKDVKKGRHKVDGTVMIPSTHDIVPENLPEAITVIGKLLKAGNDILIVSKAHFDCIGKLCDEFKEYKDKILFRFSIGALNDKLLKYWEPKATAFAERFLCLRHCHNVGFKTSVSIEPMLDVPYVDMLIIRLLPYITDAVWVGKMNNISSRVKIETDEDRRQVAVIEHGQLDSNIQIIYNALKDNPKVKWKESIKKVVGVELADKAGMDI